MRGAKPHYAANIIISFAAAIGCQRPLRRRRCDIICAIIAAAPLFYEQPRYVPVVMSPRSTTLVAIVRMTSLLRHYGAYYVAATLWGALPLLIFCAGTR